MVFFFKTPYFIIIHLTFITVTHHKMYVHLIHFRGCIFPHPSRFPCDYVLVSASSHTTRHCCVPCLIFQGGCCEGRPRVYCLPRQPRRWRRLLLYRLKGTRPLAAPLVRVMQSIQTASGPPPSTENLAGWPPPPCAPARELIHEMGMKVPPSPVTGLAR